jgi:hypothetical protein
LRDIFGDEYRVLMKKFFDKDVPPPVVGTLPQPSEPTSLPFAAAVSQSAPQTAVMPSSVHHENSTVPTTQPTSRKRGLRDIADELDEALEEHIANRGLISSGGVSVVPKRQKVVDSDGIEIVDLSGANS